MSQTDENKIIYRGLLTVEHGESFWKRRKLRKEIKKLRKDSSFESKILEYEELTRPCGYKPSAIWIRFKTTEDDLYNIGNKLLLLNGATAVKGIIFKEEAKEFEIMKDYLTSEGRQAVFPIYGV